MPSPSMRRKSGFFVRLSIACRMARMVACRILMRSISSEETIPIPKVISGCVIRILKRESLFLGVSFLLSLMPGIRVSSGIVNAAATTGPARGPLPASSTPAMLLKPALRASRSKVCSSFKRCLSLSSMSSLRWSGFAVL